MTSKAVRASFKATAVYPLNCKVVDIPGAVNDKLIVTPTEKLAKWKGIKYNYTFLHKSLWSERKHISTT